MGKTILEKVNDKIRNGWVLCQNIKYGIPYWYFLKDEKQSKYPYISEEIFYNELFNNVPYRRYNYTTSVYYEEIKNSMALQIYEVPESIKQMFFDAPISYRICDDTISAMDNIQSMNFFLEYIECEPNLIVEDYGTQVILEHPDYDFKIVIDSGVLGDFYSHGFVVTKLTAKA